MPVVSNTVLDPSSVPLRVAVTVRLIAGETGYEPGYTEAGVVAGTVRTTANDSGVWSVTLTSNADITPANSYYEVLERIPGRNVSYQHFISVPDGAGPYALADILVDEPDAPDVLAIAITQKGADNGVATLDADGQVPLSQLGNVEGGGGAVTSVAGRTGAVVLTAGDIASGTFAIARIPTGSTSSTVPLGDHTHDDRYFTEAEVTTSLATKATKLVVRNLRVEEATNLTFPSTSGNWQFLTGLAVSIPAAVGDYVELTWNFMWDTTGNNFLDWHINVSSTIVRAMSSDTATPKNEGAPWLYPGADAFDKSPGPWGIVVTAPMLSGGNLTCQLAAKSVGSGTIFRSTDYPFTAKLKNFGACDVA